MNGSDSTLQGVNKNPYSMSLVQLCPLLHTGVIIGRAGFIVSNLQHSIRYQELKCIYFFGLFLSHSLFSFHFS